MTYQYISVTDGSQRVIDVRAIGADAASFTIKGLDSPDGITRATSAFYKVVAGNPEISLTADATSNGLVFDRWEAHFERDKDKQVEKSETFKLDLSQDSERNLLRIECHYNKPVA